MAEPNKTMWRGQSATLTIETIQDLTRGHITSYTFDVYNGSTIVNESFPGAGDDANNGRSISTSAHVAEGNTNGYTDYTVKGYLKYKHNAYNKQTTATSNVVNKSLRVQEPLDTESLTGFEINPTEVWSNVAGKQNIKINPSFRYTPFSKMAEITCSQTSTALGGGSDGYHGVTKLELNGDQNCYVIYENNNANKDLGAASKYIEFLSYSSTGTSADIGAFLYSRSLLVKNAVTGLSIPASLTTYNNASSWNPNQSVDYTPGTPYSKEVSLVYAEGDTAYDGNTISQNGISVTLNPSTGAFTFNVSNPKDVTKTSTFKFRVKSTQGQNPVYSNPMTFTVNGYTPSYNITIIEGETYTIEDLGIGTFDIPTETIPNIFTVKKTGHDLGISIKANAVSDAASGEFIITSTNGSQVTITCTVTNLKDLDYSINTGDTITIGGQEITAGVGTTITGITAITTGPTQGKGTAYVSEDKLIYYAPATAVGIVPITVTTDTGASVVININVVAIDMTIA